MIKRLFTSELLWGLGIKKNLPHLDDVISLDSFSVGSGCEAVGGGRRVQHEDRRGLGDRRGGLFGNFGLKTRRSIHFKSVALE